MASGDGVKCGEPLQSDPDRNWVRAVDVSDGCIVCVWSLSTSERLLGPFKLDYEVAAVKFSPDGRTATLYRDSVRVYDSQNGGLLIEFPIRVVQEFYQQ